MSLFVSDTTAKSILRGLIRDALTRTPTIKAVESKVRFLMQVSRNTQKMQQQLMYFLRDFTPFYSPGNKTNMDSLRCYLPYFNEGEYGWELGYRTIHVFWIMEQKQYWVQTTECDVIFTGHMLERVFQRGKIIGWDEVRNEMRLALACSHVWTNHLDTIKQVVVPTERGLYLGDTVVDPQGRQLMRLKTFVNEAQLSAVQKQFKRDYELIMFDITAMHRGNVIDTHGVDRILQLAAKVLLKKYPWLLEEHECKPA